MNSKPLLSLKNLDLIYTIRSSVFKPPLKIGAALNVNLDIHPGEVVAIVGESGCGKTTIGQAIIGMMKPTAGQVIYNGKDVTAMNRTEYQEYRSGVQLVQQNSYAALNPMRTIFKSLCGPLLHKKLAKNRAEALEKAREAMQLVELNPDDIDKYPHELSGGQRQRLLMARAILMKPKLIVADEPVSMIDVSLRIAILNLMARLNEQLGIAFVYITHDFGTARYIARNGKILIMYLARMAEFGDVQTVLENPSHPYLQALLTAVPIPDPEIARQKRELPLKSIDMPSAAFPPSGCRFHPRCPYANEVCEQDEPQLLPHRDVLCACHRVDEIPKWSLRGESDE